MTPQVRRIDASGNVRRARMSACLAEIDTGSSAVELAVLAPVILLIIFSIVQFALIEYGANVALSSARQAVSGLRIVDPAQCGQRQSAVSADTLAYARSLGSASLLDPAVTLTCGDSLVSATVRGHAVSVVPGLTVTVSRTATGRVEQFIPDSP